MFDSKSKWKITYLSEIFGDAIKELENIFQWKVIHYIDYANVRSRYKKLDREIELKRLKQFLYCFDNTQWVNFYYGEDTNIASKKFLEKVANIFSLSTKPVKHISVTIDVSGLKPNSRNIIDNFMRKELLQRISDLSVGSINKDLAICNQNGEKFINIKKCNFDVEMAMDMILDAKENKAETIVLRSWDSDFADAVKRLNQDGKKICIFMTSSKWNISKELRNSDCILFDIKKIKEFICENKYIKTLTEDFLQKSQRDSD